MFVKKTGLKQITPWQGGVEVKDMGKPVFIFVNGRKINAGQIENETYTKIISQTKHFHKLLNSFGFQSNMIPRLKQEAVKLIELKDVESNQTFRTTLETLLSHGVEKDFGHGKQLFLALKNFSVDSTRQLSMFKEVRYVSNN